MVECSTLKKAFLTNIKNCVQNTVTCFLCSWIRDTYPVA